MPRRPPKAPRPSPAVDLADPAALDNLLLLELAQRRSRERYATDPWAFITECCWTVDRIQRRERPFPNKPHLEYLARVWIQEPRMVVEKSRRMIVTWLFCALYYWMARFQPLSLIAFMARKEGNDETAGSAELVMRARFIHEHMPPTLPRVEAEWSHCKGSFDNGSQIVGLPEGSDQPRQQTFSGVLADEFGFWKKARATWNSLVPTTEGGGRITVVSTVPEEPGSLFEALVSDGLNRSEFQAA